MSGTPILNVAGCTVWITSMWIQGIEVLQDELTWKEGCAPFEDPQSDICWKDWSTRSHRLTTPYSQTDPGAAQKNKLNFKPSCTIKVPTSLSLLNTICDPEMPRRPELTERLDFRKAEMGASGIWRAMHSHRSKLTLTSFQVYIEAYETVEVDSLNAIG